MAGFAAIIGGAMEGWSSAKLDEIKAERDARMSELESQRQDKRAADEQSFRSKEADIGRTFEAGQADKTRSFQADQADKTRAASGDLITDDKGNSLVRNGSTAKPLTDDQGNPVKVASAGGKADAKPAEVSTAEWLIQQGVAKNPADAWKMVRSARDDPEKSRAGIYKAWMDALTKGAMGSPDPVELEKQAREATEKTLTYLNQDDSAAGGAAKPGGSASEAIPAQPADRTVGKTYTNSKGQKAIWKGGGWEPVQ